MISETRAKRIDNAMLFQSVVIDLYEAVMFSNRQEMASRQVDELLSRQAERLGDVDELQRDIAKLLKHYFETNLTESFKQTSEAITKFSKTALDQYKDKVRQEFHGRELEIEESNSSYATKAIKGIESFLFSEPFPINESSTFIKFVEGGYQAVRRVKCAGNVDYDIILNTSRIELLDEELYFSHLSKGLQIPIRQSTSWISKETVVDKEKLDSYKLVNAEYAHGTLITLFRDEESRSDFRFVLSGAEKQPVLSIEYRDEQESVDIYAHPALQNYVNSRAVNMALLKLLNSIKLLRTSPVKVQSLTLEEEDILTSQSFRKLSDLFFEVSGDRVKSGISHFLKNGPLMEELELDTHKVAERLKFLNFFDEDIERTVSEFENQ